VNANERMSPRNILQALGNNDLICPKGHAFVTVYTHNALMGVREHTDTHTHTHTATAHSLRVKNFAFTQNRTVG
jgi:hypothetical protein